MDTFYSHIKEDFNCHWPKACSNIFVLCSFITFHLFYALRWTFLITMFSKSLAVKLALHHGVLIYVPPKAHLFIHLCDGHLLLPCIVTVFLQLAPLMLRSYFYYWSVCPNSLKKTIILYISNLLCDGHLWISFAVQGLINVTLPRMCCTTYPISSIVPFYGVANLYMLYLSRYNPLEFLICFLMIVLLIRLFVCTAYISWDSSYLFFFCFFVLCIKEIATKKNLINRIQQLLSLRELHRIISHLEKDF